MKKGTFFIGILFVLGTLVFVIILKQAVPSAPALPQEEVFVPPATEEPFAYRDMVVVEEPALNDLIQSPVTVRGKARGTWFFEANFPVRVIDSNGEELGVGIAFAEDEWMTEDYVPFSATVEFRFPISERGTLVLEKDNPSGLAEHADAYRIPIRFH